MDYCHQDCNDSVTRVLPLVSEAISIKVKKNLNQYLMSALLAGETKVTNYSNDITLESKSKVFIFSFL